MLFYNRNRKTQEVLFVIRIDEVLTEEIKKRCSRRRFSEKPITVQEEVEILKVIEKINDEGNLEFQCCINYGDEAFEGLKASYGIIKGCSSYVALVGDSRDETIEEKIGYYGEYLVLKLTQMGFGTCWVGGTFDKKGVAKDIKTEYSDKIYCVIALGNLEGKEKTSFEKVIGFFGRNRKSIGELFYSIKKIKAEDKRWIENGLECVRKAPSALNSQPWIFGYNGENIYIKSKGNKTGFEKIDLGIAMLHFQMGAEEKGFKGQWKFIKNCWEFIKK